ncbi:MAG: DUF3088 domain-containing protein [Parasphingorhabdus sp.]
MREKDILFLLEPGFEDPALPGRKFYCPYCAQVEGVLASYAEHTGNIEVVRLPFPRPRRATIELVGEEHQSLPLMVLASDAPRYDFTLHHGEVRFVSKTADILRLLHLRHGIDEIHP